MQALILPLQISHFISLFIPSAEDVFGIFYNLLMNTWRFFFAFNVYTTKVLPKFDVVQQNEVHLQVFDGRPD